MPIRPSEKSRYPKNWKEISDRIRARAGGRCECEGECDLDHYDRGENRCREVHGATAGWNLKKLVKVVLTTAHLDHTPENCEDENLKAMCQLCHLRYDRHHHARTARATRESNKGPELPLNEEET